MTEQETKFVLVNIDMTSNSIHQNADKEVRDSKDVVNDLKDSHKELSKDFNKEVNKDTKQIGVNPLAGVADISPNKRYIRWNDIISKSSGERSSYKAFDTRNGIEVVWHTIDLNSLEESEQNRVTKCVKMIQKVQKPLDEFIGKVMTLRWRIVKKWSKQILRGLDFLHTSKPEIVHRNLSCSHIYINGGTSHTNIGDLWTAAILAENEDAPIGLTTTAASAYTAPEEQLSTKLDVYSFGMCLLEMITREKPYMEFKGSYDLIREHAINGKLPKALDRVTHPLARQCIELCLQPVDRRPDAAELLQHAFLQPGLEDDEELKLGGNLEFNLQAPRTCPSSAAVTPRERATSLEAISSATTTPNMIVTQASALISKTKPTIAAPIAAPEAGILKTELTESNITDRRTTKLASTDIPQPPPVIDGKSLNTTPEIKTIKLLSTTDINSPSPLKLSRHIHQSLQITTSSPSSGVPVIPLLSISTPNQTERKKQTLSQELADFDQSENVQEDKGIHDGRSREVDDELTPHQSGMLNPVLTRNDSAKSIKGNPALTRNDSAKSIKGNTQSQMTSAQESQVLVNNVLINEESEATATPKQVMIQGKSSSLEVSSEDSKLQLIIFIPAEKTKTKTTDQEIEFDYDVLNENFEGVAKEMIEELGILVPVQELAGQIESLVRQAIRTKKEAKRANPGDETSAVYSLQHQQKPPKPANGTLQLSSEKKDTTIVPISFLSAAPSNGLDLDAHEGTVSQVTLNESVSPLSLSESIERKAAPISISELTERLIAPATIELVAADTSINLPTMVESKNLNMDSTQVYVTAQSVEVENVPYKFSNSTNETTSHIAPLSVNVYERRPSGVQQNSEGTQGSYTGIQQEPRCVHPNFETTFSELSLSGHNNSVLISRQPSPPVSRNLDSFYHSNNFDPVKNSNINPDDCSITSSTIASTSSQQQFVSTNARSILNHHLTKPSNDIPVAITLSVDYPLVSNGSSAPSSSSQAITSLPTASVLDPLVSISADQVQLISLQSSPQINSKKYAVTDETSPPKQLVSSGALTAQTSIPLDNLNQSIPSSSSLANQAKGRSRSNTLTLEMSDAEVGEIQKELEKIEKEARAARRAFEQRIQKHKIIQEKCQEDMQKLEEEYSAKMADLDRKEENCLRKKELEIQKVYADLELKQRNYKEKKRAARAQARVARERHRPAQQQNSPHLQEQPLNSIT